MKLNTYKYAGINMSKQEKKTAEEWGKELGHWHSPSGISYDQNGFWKREYAAANALHGWSRHAYHYASDPLLMTKKQFLAAIDAAQIGPDPYGPALSKIKDKR